MDDKGGKGKSDGLGHFYDTKGKPMEPMRVVPMASMAVPAETAAPSAEVAVPKADMGSASRPNPEAAVFETSKKAKQDVNVGREGVAQKEDAKGGPSKSAS